MTTERTFARLRKLFHGAASLSALGAVGACGGVASVGSGQDAGPTDGAVIIPVKDGAVATGFTENVCTGTEYKPLVGVTPKEPVDYLEVRSESDRAPGDTSPATVSASAKEGTPCKTASNVAKCNATLTDTRSTAGWIPESAGMVMPTHRYLVYTRGDTVGTVTSLADLAAFIAPLENAHDAALLVSERSHRFDCTKDNATKTADGYDLLTETGHTCGAGTGIDQHVVAVSGTGAVDVKQTVRIKDGDPNCAIGRRPEGFARTETTGAEEVGTYFAQIAELEAASVHAFERLAAELRAHGAPAELIDAALRSAKDEVRHAATTTKLARKFGRDVSAPRVDRLPVRGLFEIARENAVEGCVRETFGALQATFQAKRAKDASVARAMRGIAVDETRHAALAWDVAAWAEARLTAEERAEVIAARNDAVAALERDLRVEPSAEVAELAGAPREEEARLLFASVRQELWQA
jgi:hypothetical protein